jgi:hypothetical protein
MDFHGRQRTRGEVARGAEIRLSMAISAISSGRTVMERIGIEPMTSGLQIP